MILICCFDLKLYSQKIIYTYHGLKYQTPNGNLGGVNEFFELLFFQAGMIVQPILLKNLKMKII